MTPTINRRDALRLGLGASAIMGTGFWPGRVFAAAAKTPHIKVGEPMETTAFDHFYNFLAMTTEHAPTPLQLRAILQAEDIWRHTRHWDVENRTQEERLEATRKTLGLYDEMTAQYAVLRVRWDGRTALLDKRSQVVLAKGIVRHVICELHNESGQPVPLSIETPGAPGVALSAANVPPGEMRPLLISLLANDTAGTNILLRIPSPLGEPAFEMPVPVEVSESARLRGRLFDGDDVFPGRVYCECSDHILRHAKAYADNDTMSKKAAVFRPLWYRFPFFYSDGTFEIDVPAGKTHLTLERGYEHPFFEKTIEAAAGETHEIELKSRRVFDMKARGWVSGDTHVHWAKNSWDVNEAISLLGVVQRAEDVRVVNNLTLYQWREQNTFIKPDQYPMGPVPGMCDDEYHIEMGEEYRNDRLYGHINLLGIDHIVQPIATGPGSGGPPDAIDWPHNVKAFEETHAMGGIVCEAHGMGPFANGPIPINVLNGHVDCLDQMDPRFYYHLLNCGMRIALGNGSDHPARPVGCARMYVLVDGEWTYDKWLDGIRKNRTFVTSGPLLFLTVNGKPVGAEMNVSKGDPLRVEVHAQARNPLVKVEILANGEVVKSVETNEDNTTVIYETTAEESVWFAARCAPGEVYTPIGLDHEHHAAFPDIAHTSGLYVDVEGKPVRNADSIRFFIDRMGWHLKQLKDIGNFENEEQRAFAVGYVEKGIEDFKRLLAEAEA